MSLGRVLSLGWVAALGVMGCGEDGAVQCTDLAAASVNVEVVDVGGIRLTDAVVSFSVDGGPEQECNSFGDGTFTCGYEIRGDFTITAKRGVDTKTTNVTVTGDECHVQGQSVKFTFG